MSSTFARLDARLRRLPDVVILLIGLAMVAAIAVLKVTGHGVPVIDFLLIPVAGVGWLASSPRFAYVAAVVAAGASVAIGVVGQEQPMAGAAVASGAARLVLYFVVLALLGAMRRMQCQLDAEARTDQQTGAANARAFNGLAQAEIGRSRRYQHELSLAYLDLDDFKALNDRLGHLEGDRVLAQVGHVMRSMVRSEDTVARLGGDEFAILMPETRAADARAVVNRVRREMARVRTADGRPVPCSVGVVTFARAPVSLDELVGAGDHLMYRAKEHGKDRVETGVRAGVA